MRSEAARIFLIRQGQSRYEVKIPPGEERTSLEKEFDSNKEHIGSSR